MSYARRVFGPPPAPVTTNRPTPSEHGDGSLRRGSAFKTRPATSTAALVRELERVAEVVEDEALRLAIRTLAGDVEVGTPITYHLEQLARTFARERAARCLVWLARDAAALERRE